MSHSDGTEAFEVALHYVEQQLLKKCPSVKKKKTVFVLIEKNLSKLTINLIYTVPAFFLYNL